MVDISSLTEQGTTTCFTFPAIHVTRHTTNCPFSKVPLELSISEPLQFERCCIQSSQISSIRFDCLLTLPMNQRRFPVHTRCIHSYIHSYIHTNIHSCVHTNINSYIHTHIHTYIHTYTRFLQRFLPGTAYINSILMATQSSF